ncbi:MAG: magnesium-translocating P-type ATPase [Candidatus Aenigmatarchaeota archaeon]
MMEWWSKTGEEVIKILNSSPEGLSEAEARKRIAVHGLNDIPKRMEKSVLSIFLYQVKDPLFLILFFAALIAGFTGGIDEAIIIIAILFVNVLVGFFQEYKSEKALQKLCKYIRYWTKVVREGNLREIDTRYIVPGDIVLLETGDRVPADVRLLEADDLEIDESLVTGESYPVLKKAELVMEEKVEPHEMKNMAFMGTLVKSGKGKGIVVATGMKSTFGKIVGFIKSEEPLSNYQKSMRKLSRFLMQVVIAGVIFIFIINSITGKKLFDSLLFSLALAIGIVPEALPVVITIGLSRGAIRMSKVGVITKKLAVIEDLGNMDVLCIDKTGTLTQNKITLIDYLNLDGKKDEGLVLLSSVALSVVEKKGKLFGNAIDVAIGEFVKNLPKPDYEVVDTIPFDYDRKRMSSVIKYGRKFLLVCKGAPESLISVCSKMKKNGKIVKIDKSFVEKFLEELFKKGYRVIGVARKFVEKKSSYKKDEEKDLTLLGFLCFTDPPKPGIKETVKSLKKLGVDIKVLTGDNALIAEKVMREVGIEVKGVLSGLEIEAMDEEGLKKVVEEVNLFVRLTPDQKVKIVKALKKNGHVVGFLGDGANDAPAMKYADVGISVENGIDVAKEASDVILTRKSLKVILDGIVEGRTTFGNTTKYILNTLSANLGNMTSLAIVSPLLDFLPMLPSQILLTNLISDGPLLSISTDRIDEEELSRPRQWNLNFVAKFCVIFGLISSIFDFLTMASLLFLLGINVSAFRTGWFMESVLSEILVTFAIRTRKRFYKSRPSKILLLTSIIFASLTIWIIYSPFNTFFEFTPLDLPFFLLIISILLCYFLIAEISKKIVYRIPEFTIDVKWFKLKRLNFLHAS